MQSSCYKLLLWIVKESAVLFAIEKQMGAVTEVTAEQEALCLLFMSD